MPKLRKETKAELSAVFANDAVIRTYRNQTVVSKVTVPRPSDSIKRKEINDLFTEANSWAKETLKDPAMREYYEKGVNDKLSNAHTVALTDYLHAPEIHYVNLKDYTGTPGDPIRIKATDNFRVTSVIVKITNAKGILLEEDEAIRYKRKPTMWLYNTKIGNPLLPGTVFIVSAMDLPGNVTEMEYKLSGE
ncbi:MAG: hypothetical protein HOP08_02465 [Cyclobacteriaceae bacterium]|nr:hypothetical protein [Cyclobacteriaceae bacterium]